MQYIATWGRELLDQCKTKLSFKCQNVLTAVYDESLYDHKTITVYEVKTYFHYLYINYSAAMKNVQKKQAQF